MLHADSYDVIVVGGGPAGLAVAVNARLAGMSVTVLDRRPAAAPGVLTLIVADPSQIEGDAAVFTVRPGETFNIGGGEEVNVLQVLAILGEFTGKTPRTTHGPKRPGDQRRTAADIAKARARLGYDPTTTVREGLAAQLAWQREELERED